MTDPANKPLTLKQSKLVKARAAGLTLEQAGLAAGAGTPVSARVYAHETLKKPNVQAAVQAELAKQGLDLATVVKPITDAIKADKLTEEGWVPDHSIRLNASWKALTLMGAVQKDATNLNINFNQFAQKQREDYQI